MEALVVPGAGVPVPPEGPEDLGVGAGPLEEDEGVHRVHADLGVDPPALPGQRAGGLLPEEHEAGLARRGHGFDGDGGRRLRAGGPILPLPARGGFPPGAAGGGAVEGDGGARGAGGFSTGGRGSEPPSR